MDQRYFPVAGMSLTRVVIFLCLLVSCARTRVSVEMPKAQGFPKEVKTAETTSKAEKSPRLDHGLQEMEAFGVKVGHEILPLSSSHRGRTVQAGDDVEVRFTIRDATTGSPVSGSRPGVWIDPRVKDRKETCQEKIEAWVAGSLMARAEYDLNEFYVLILNDEPSISVVDPLFGYGGTKLLAQIGLPAPGEDWVLSGDSNRLYVSMPLVNQVAVVDTSTWTVTDLIHVAMQPTRVGLQPDEKYLWVSGRSADSSGVVSVIDTDDLKITATLRIGQGFHDFAFSSDSSRAYVADAGSGTVTIIDVGVLKPVAEWKVGPTAGEVVYSPVSRCAYVVDSDGGTVAVIDGATDALIRRVKAKSGLGTIRATPDGRYLLVANEKQATVDVIDVASDSVIQTADVGPEPDQIIFTLSLAYVRSRGSELILMIPLDQIGGTGSLSVADFSGGHAPFGLAKKPSLADGMAAAPSGLAAIVANPIDRSVYYYREGMAAPMGAFQSYGREPRAVLVVDRSLKEKAPGVYSTAVHIDHPGVYDVAFLLDVPRIVHCFELQVEKNPQDAVVSSAPKVKIEPQTPTRPIVVGQPVRMRYVVTDTATGKPMEELDDLAVIAFSTRNWQQRRLAESVGKGVYEVSLVLPQPGVYYVMCRVPSLKLEYRDLPSRVLNAKPSG